MFKNYTNEFTLFVSANPQVHPELLEMNINVLRWLKAKGLTNVNLLFGVGDAVSTQKVKTCNYAPYFPFLKENFFISAKYCKRYVDVADVNIYEDINLYEKIQQDFSINKIEHEIQDNGYLIAKLKEKKILINLGCNLDAFNTLFTYLTKSKNANTYIRTSYTGINLFINGTPLKINAVGLDKYSTVINTFDKFKNIDEVDSEMGLFDKFKDLDTSI